jgi:cation transport ATPase
MAARLLETMVAKKEELQRRLQRILRWSLPVMVIMLISTVLSLVGVDSEPWLWTRTILFGIAVLVMGVQITRFSLWQRDEYWRERGRDPKHPERFPSAEAE